MEELRGCHDTDSIQRYNMLHDKMDCLIMQEEAFWKQRAKVFWLREGDGNTRFFHAMANARKKRNVITALTDEDDRTVEHQSHVSSTCPRGGEELTVADFIDASRGHWKVDMIRSFFSAADVNRILSIHLSRLDREDSLIWKLSKDGRVKCNVDAALFADQNGFGVGLCLRDDKCQYIKSKVLYHHGSPPPREAEALGLLDALSWLGELGMLEVDIELDCKEVVDALHGEAGSLNEFV
ncbi:Ribonuclease H-like superfamily [Sesbania bispinosa]|nr:Ribonuclease H-like superfamily [Sesbania bispinosa]